MQRDRIPHRLTVVGEKLLRDELIASLRSSGFSSITEYDRIGTSIEPCALLFLVGVDIALTVEKARRASALAHVPILAAVRPMDPSIIAGLAKAGIDDVLFGPPFGPEVEIRVRANLRAGQERIAASEAQQAEQVLGELLRLSSGVDGGEALREILSVAADFLGYQWAGIILVSEMFDQAYLVSTSEHARLSKIPINLDDYPEVRLGIDEKEPFVISDLSDLPSGEDRETLARLGVGAAALFTVENQGRVCGVTLLRKAEERGLLEERLCAFGQSAAIIISKCLVSSHVLDSLREQTNRISIVGYESERRSRAIEQLREYFEASSEGVFVVDGDDRILVSNRAAQVMTGFAQGGLVGRPLTDLVPDAQREGLTQAIASVLGGTNLEAFDLEFPTTSGDRISISVATSTMLSDHGAAILSFRDVTKERLLEGELRKTKEFLEKLIDSAVDAIIAADILGNLILFNPGAERIFGWTADEVLGRMHVDCLYPPGVARQVMRMLRSESFGGVGKLELTRRDIMTREGEQVPVNMTASIIYEEGREIATVGILSDLRERIRIEERLLIAQEQLVVREKQALVAELAGAAAHELNQPLTSVMGYAELIQRRIGREDPNSRAVDTILSEAVRMAEIVKKIGRMTKYETKAYVGSAQILDIDRSIDKSHER